MRTIVRDSRAGHTASFASPTPEKLCISPESALAALDRLPALRWARERVLLAAGQRRPARTEIVEAVHSDVALAAAVLRQANLAQPRQIGTVEDAVAVLEPAELVAVARGLPSFDFFGETTLPNLQVERFRVHALAVCHAVECIERASGRGVRGELRVAALLHDIGKVVLAGAFPDWPPDALDAHTPEHRVLGERVELGTDHALAGGVLGRACGYPSTLVEVIETHHDVVADRWAATVRLADMLANYQRGAPVDVGQLSSVSARISLSEEALGSIMYELPRPLSRITQSEPCPLSPRELQVLRALAAGKVYKVIAQELTLSTSTVRSHLHRIYSSLAVVDRAQAVLVAREKGWI